jgi:hypothetical protein
MWRFPFRIVQVITITGGHLAPTVDDSNQVVTVTSTTTYTVWFVNGTYDSCSADITITVDSLNPLLVNSTSETCLGDNDGTITVSPATGGIPSYTYQITGPVTFSQVNNGNFTNLPPGTYNISATDSAGCQSFSTFIVDAGPDCSITSNSQTSKKQMFMSFYPNPTAGNVTLYFNLGQYVKAADVKVISQNGSVVYQNTVNDVFETGTIELPLDQLSDGLYHLVLSNGTTIMNKRLIIQK